MPNRFTITFSPDRPYEFYVPVFWLGEDLYSYIGCDGLGIVCDVDSARDVLWFDLADNHDLGRVSAG